MLADIPASRGWPRSFIDGCIDCFYLAIERRTDPFGYSRRKRGGEPGGCGFSGPVMGPPGADPGSVRFESRKVTDDLPNSVVFSYDVSSLEPKEVIIQQSWDERRREVVPANGRSTLRSIITLAIL